MNLLKKYFFSLLTTIVFILILLFFLTIIYYNNFISEKTYNLMKLLITIFSIFISSIYLGNSINIEKKYKIGLNNSILLIFIILIPTIIAKELEIKLLLYYLIITTTSILGTSIKIKKRNLRFLL